MLLTARLLARRDICYCACCACCLRFAPCDAWTTTHLHSLGSPLLSLLFRGFLGLLLLQFAKESTRPFKRKKARASLAYLTSLQCVLYRLLLRPVPRFNGAGCYFIAPRSWWLPTPGLCRKYSGGPSRPRTATAATLRRRQKCRRTWHALKKKMPGDNSQPQNTKCWHPAWARTTFFFFIEKSNGGGVRQIPGVEGFHHNLQALLKTQKFRTIFQRSSPFESRRSFCVLRSFSYLSPSCVHPTSAILLFAAFALWWTACRWTFRWPMPGFTKRCKPLRGTAAHLRQGWARKRSR